MRTFPMVSRLRFARVIFSVGIVVASWPGFVHASGQWRSLGPFGAQVRALVIDPLNPSSLYAGTNGGVWRGDEG